MFAYYLPDYPALCSVAVAFHGVKNIFRLLGSHNGYQLALVGDVKRVKPQYLAGGGYGLADWYFVFQDGYAHL
jgi:hypothetical protein